MQLNEPNDAELSHSVALPSEGMRRRLKHVTYRSDRNAARSSSANSCGCSQAAK